MINNHKMFVCLPAKSHDVNILKHKTLYVKFALTQSPIVIRSLVPTNMKHLHRLASLPLMPHLLRVRPPVSFMMASQT